MITLAVTGAAGYLGGRVVAAGAADPELDVRPIVRSGAPWLQGVTTVRSLERDASHALRGAEAVIHLAGANEIASTADPDRTLAMTVAASHAVAESCARRRIRRLVYVSTVHVYGASLSPGTTVDEATVPEPRSSYAIARLASEHILASYAGDAELIILRLTNAIGAPAYPQVDRWSLVANDLCRQAASGGPLRLRTPGQQWRDFIALDDVVSILLDAVRPGALAPGTYNLGSGRPLSIRALAGMVAAEATLCGLGEMTVQAPRADGPAPLPYTVSVQRLADAGYRPSVPLAVAIRETLSFCAAHAELRH